MNVNLPMRLVRNLALRPDAEELVGPEIAKACRLAWLGPDDDDEESSS